MSIVSLCLSHSVQTVIQNSGILFKFKLSTFCPVTMTLSCVPYTLPWMSYTLLLRNTLHLSHMKLVLVLPSHFSFSDSLPLPQDKRILQEG